MTAPVTINQQQNVDTTQKANDKELNFRALEAKYQRQIEIERQGRLEAEQKTQEALKRHEVPDDEDDDHDPYVDHKRLKKEQAKFGQQIKKETQSEIQQAVHSALGEERRLNWLKQNADFADVMQYAEKLAEKDPELADTILQMPDTFERQKLVYKTIKASGVNLPERKEPSVQEKVDANKRSPYYQPSGVGSAPYAGAGDFSPSGQKNAYEQMVKLKARLRLG